jgi:hypothetical protein
MEQLEKTLQDSTTEISKRKRKKSLILSKIMILSNQLIEAEEDTKRLKRNQRVLFVSAECMYSAKRILLKKKTFFHHFHQLVIPCARLRRKKFKRTAKTSALNKTSRSLAKMLTSCSTKLSK